MRLQERWYRFVDEADCWFSDRDVESWNVDWSDFYSFEEVEICEITRDQKRMTAFTLRGY